jgi:hypothetical protein
VTQNRRKFILNTSISTTAWPIKVNVILKIPIHKSYSINIVPEKAILYSKI